MQRQKVRENCVVGVQLAVSMARAFEVCVSEAGDVYLNFSMAGVPEAHASYHASGQQHMKKGGKHDLDGKLFTTPPKEVITRRACYDAVAWKIAELSTALNMLTEPADMVVDARGLSENALLLFRVWVVGLWAKKRNERPGFAKIKTHRFGSSVRVEIEAFEVSPSAPTIVSVAAF